MNRVSIVVATQNEAVGHLDALPAVAADLRTLLADPGNGGCTLVDARPTTKADVEQAVSGAIRTAGERQAVLVLAFLGHGFATDQDSHLYYMAADTRPASPASGVDVSRLLVEAAGEPGVAGVIALVDTCHAAGGVPDVHRITGGAGGGRTQVAVLFAATADQPAFRSQCTAALNDVLRHGVPGAGPYLHLGRDLVRRVRDRVTGQNVGYLDYDANPYAMGELWLAHNAAHRALATDEVVGPTGQERLRAAVAAWRPDFAFPERWTESALEELGSYLTGAASPGEQAVANQIRAVLDCVRTATALDELLGARLTTTHLLSAARLANIEPDHALSGTTLLRDLVERATLRHARVRGHPLAAVVTFVAALAVATDLDRAEPALRAWAAERHVSTELNDAFAAVTTARQVAETRLVVSLANALTGWPEQVEAWLRQGRQLPRHHRVPCARTDRPSVEAAIGAVITWAGRQLPDGESLEHVDVVAPAHLLASFYPEEAFIGVHRLGAFHTVTPRWSGRLRPAAGQGDINPAARKILAGMATADRAPVDWLTADDLADPAALQRRFAAGVTGALGLGYVPDDLPDVLDLLLPYSPVLLWPRPDSATGAWPALAAKRWRSWPDNLLLAYRHRLRGETDPESCLRTAWHDEQWLEFCRWFETRTVTPLEEMP